MFGLEGLRDLGLEGAMRCVPWLLIRAAASLSIPVQDTFKMLKDTFEKVKKCDTWVLQHTQAPEL